MILNLTLEVTKKLHDKFKNFLYNERLEIRDNNEWWFISHLMEELEEYREEWSKELKELFIKMISKN